MNGVENEAEKLVKEAARGRAAARLKEEKIEEDGESEDVETPEELDGVEEDDDERRGGG